MTSTTKHLMNVLLGLANEDDTTLGDGETRDDYEDDYYTMNEDEEDAAAAAAARAEAIECDYEKNCTPLYKAMENAHRPQDWEIILKFLQTGNWSGSTMMMMFAAIPSLISGNNTPPTDAATQARTWVTRFDYNEPTQVRWSQLPIHLAIVCQAPVNIIQKLIELYPDGTRCTDDMRNLPLHLALRHDCPDDVVACLTEAFPNAILARGKDDRTPLDCALRATKLKDRANMLNMFCQKYKARGISQSQAQLKHEIESKMVEIAHLQAEVESLKDKMAQQENDLTNKIGKLERTNQEAETISKTTIKQIEDKQLVEELEIQHQIKALEEEKKRVAEAERIAREEELTLRQELDSVHKALADTGGDLQSVKDQVSTLKESRLTALRVSFADQLKSLKQEITTAISHAQGKTKESLEEIQKKVTKLDGTDVNNKSLTELENLKAVSTQLRQQVRDHEEVTQTKIELGKLKKVLLQELSSQRPGRSEEERDTLERVVNSIDETDLELKNKNELAAMKSELMKLKSDFLETTLVNKTKDDLNELTQKVNKESATATDTTTRTEWDQLKNDVDRFNKLVAGTKSRAELLELKKQIDQLRETVYEKDLSVMLKRQLIEIQNDIVLLESHSFMNDDVIKTTKKPTKLIDPKNLGEKSVKDLQTIKDELVQVKDDLERKERFHKARKDLDHALGWLKSQTNEWKGVAKQEIMTMIKSVRELCIMNATAKTKDDQDKVDSDIANVLKNVRNAEEATRIKKEHQKISKALQEATQKVKEGLMKNQLTEWKKICDSIQVDNLELRKKETWDAIKKQVEGIKKEMLEKNLLIETRRRSRSAGVPVKSAKGGNGGIMKVFSFFGIKNKARTSSAEYMDVNVVSPPSLTRSGSGRSSPGHSSKRFKKEKSNKNISSTKKEETTTSTIPMIQSVASLIDPITGQVELEHSSYPKHEEKKDD